MLNGVGDYDFVSSVAESCAFGWMLDWIWVCLPGRGLFVLFFDFKHVKIVLVLIVWV